MKKQNLTSKGQTMSIANKNEKSSQNSNSPEELIKRTQVKDTPFTIIEVNGECFGTFGKYRITENTPKEQLIKELSTPSWDRIVQIAVLIHQALTEEHKPTK